LSALEHIWTYSECVWTPLSEHWTWLNALECTWMPLSESECDWTHLTTDSYMKLSVHEHLEWVCMRLNALWVRLDAIELVLKALERAWTRSECMWAPLSEYGTWLNVLEHDFLCKYILKHHKKDPKARKYTLEGYTHLLRVQFCSPRDMGRSLSNIHPQK
jgi:hypothetical protein